jgi:2-dehydro-3-deoxygluconokinase
MEMEKDFICNGALNMDMLFKIESGYEPILRDVGRMVGKELPFDGHDDFPQDKFPEVMDFLYKRLPVTKSSGGSASNVAYYLREMGFSVGFAGRTGKDEDSDKLIADLGLDDTRGIVRGDGYCGYVVSLESADNRYMLIFPNENNNLGIDDLFDIGLETIYNTKLLHMTSFVGEQQVKLQKWLVDHAPRSVKLALDIGFYERMGFDKLTPMIAKCYTIFGNSEEFQELTGKKGFEEAVDYLLSYDYCYHGEGPQIIACKLGERGCYVRSRNEEHYVPALELPANAELHPTGTGDAFDAGFLARLMSAKQKRQRLDLYACGLYGNTLGRNKLLLVREDFHPRAEDLRVHAALNQA